MYNWKVRLNFAMQELVVEKAFIEMDADSDGRVTEEEFVRACVGHKKFSKMLALKLIDLFTQ